MFVELWEWSGDRVPLDHIQSVLGYFVTEVFRMSSWRLDILPRIVASKTSSFLLFT